MIAGTNRINITLGRRQIFLSSAVSIFFLRFSIPY